MKKVFLACILFLVETVSAQKDFENNYSSTRLTTIDQKIFSFDELKKNTASVIVFLLPDCPACESYSLTLNQLQEKFKSYGIRFYGVFPGHYNTVAEMKAFQIRYRINFPLMSDPDKKLVKSLGAKVSPEVFVISNTGKIIYRGRIDDWMYAVGKMKPGVTTHELRDALSAVIQHQPLKIPETKAIGCIIE